MPTLRRAPHLAAALAALLLTALASGARAADDPTLLPLVVENADLVEQVVAVQSLNLLNGLKLTHEQQEWLRAALFEVMGSVDELRRLAAERRDEAASLLGRLREDVAGGRTPEPLVGERVHALALEAAPLAKAHRDLLQRLAREALDLLGPAQRVVVRRYHPCLVPAALTDDESFVGAAGGDQLLEGLEKVRAVPGAVWFFVRGAVVRDVADKVTALATDLDRDAVAALAGETFDRARALPDVDWQVQRGEMARDLARKLGPLRFADGGGVPDEAKVVQFLLNPALLDVLGPGSHRGD